MINDTTSGSTSGSLFDGSTGVLDSLSADTRAELERRVQEVHLPAGTKVFETGDTGDALYLVRSGLVDLTTGPAEDQRLTTVAPGDFFGEQSLLTGRPRAATAVAQTGVTLWRLDHSDFLVLMGSDPELGAAVARTLSDRLRTGRTESDGSARGQTIVLAARPPSAAAALCVSFSAACANLQHETPVVLACGPASTWDGCSLPPATSVHQPDALAGAAVRAVREHALVVMVCGSEIPLDAFAGADRVIMTGRPVAAAARRRGHPLRVLPASPNPSEVRALAREVCGRRIGLALGSGGIRGWAHAGVLGVLTEQRIPIDFVSGASAGAIAGALFLAGVPAEAMVQVPTIARDVLSACLRTYRPSPGAILSARPFVRYLRDQLGSDARIESLPTPFVIATTDLDTREAVHLSTGPLPEAIVASAAVNGIFPPITIDGKRLVDGGASDPVPVVVLRDMGADIVVAVNVMHIGRGSAGLYTPRLRIPLPGLVDNLLIGLDTVMSQAAAQSCRLADVTVTPTQGGAAWHDLLPAAKYAAAGARAMRDALPRVRQLLGEAGG